ncbi:hypothetical protein Pla110_25550 [Polystyrenella longa]|uniref:Uncharacterized protein n=1 Tax=Polystyrenella longa TaxID=2528007 RepID=A0A518CNL9_9PLAN|nr:hypothetical protein [Polystyrenella longa]QDU80820.1 hypothetical protein Pla110_25550 [Polystyrenella longa]
MFRATGIALGLFLSTWGAFLFCTEDIVLRYNPSWIPQSGFISQFFEYQSEGNRQHLIVEQWVAILLASVGGSLMIFSLGGKSKLRTPKDEKPRHS